MGSVLKRIWAPQTAIVRTAWNPADTIVAFDRGLPGDWLMFDRRPVTVMRPLMGDEDNQFELRIGWAGVRRLIDTVMRADIAAAQGGGEVRCQSRLSSSSLVGPVMWTLLVLGPSMISLLQTARTPDSNWPEGLPVFALLLALGPGFLALAQIIVRRDHCYLAKFVSLALRGQVIREGAV